MECSICQTILFFQPLHTSKEVFFIPFSNNISKIMGQKAKATYKRKRLKKRSGRYKYIMQLPSFYLPSTLHVVIR